MRKPTMHRYISTKVLLAEGRETPFAEHCRNYENTYRVGSGSRAGAERVGWCRSPRGAAGPTDAADGDPGPEGPGAGAAPRPHQAPLAHQDGDHERDPAEVPADGCADRGSLLRRGDDAQRLRGGTAGAPWRSRAPRAMPQHAARFPLSSQDWEETYQRVANEQEIYEGTGHLTPPSQPPGAHSSAEAAAATARSSRPQPSSTTCCSCGRRTAA